MTRWPAVVSVVVVAMLGAVFAPVPQLATEVAASPEVAVPESPSSPSGYWMLERDGTVHPFGSAQNLGDASWTSNAVALVPTPTGGGYWVVSRTGGIGSYGDAVEFASAYDDVPDVELVTTAATTPTGRGLWLFTDAGRVVSRGDAGHFGDLTHLDLDGPVVGSSATPTGLGYIMVGGDGGVFAFGDAVFRGSIPGVLPAGTKLDQPIVGISTSPSNRGYWMVASDGGIFAFGDAPFRGSIPGVLPGVTLNQPVNGMVPYGNGYLMVASDGGIFNFSNLEFLGSLGANPPDTPVVGVAPTPARASIAPAATWINADPTSPLLWITEFADNAADVRRIAWYGTRSGQTLTPSRGELFAGDGAPVVIHLTTDGSDVASVVGPDGTRAVVLERYAGGQARVSIERPDGTETVEILDPQTVPAAPGTPASSPPRVGETRFAGVRQMPDRWPLLGAPSTIDIDLQPIPVDANVDLSATAARVTCTTSDDNFGCATSFDATTGRLSVLPALWIEVPDGASFFTKGECDAYNQWLFAQNVMIGMLLTITLPLSWPAAVALGLATTGFFTWSAGSCNSLDSVIDMGPTGGLQDQWLDFLETSVPVTTTACFSGRGLVYQPECVEVQHTVTTRTVRRGTDLGTRQVLVARQTPLQIRATPTATSVYVGQEIGVKVWAKGGYPAVLDGDHTYEILVDWDDGHIDRTVRTYTDERVETATLDSFANHTYDTPGQYRVFVAVENGADMDAVALSVLVTVPPPPECVGGDVDTCEAVSPVTAAKSEGDWAIYKIEQSSQNTLGICGYDSSRSVPFTVRHWEIWYIGTEYWVSQALATEADRNAHLNQWHQWVCEWGRITLHKVTVIERHVNEEWAKQRYAQIAQRLQARGYTEVYNRFFPNSWSWDHPDDGSTGSTTAGAIYNNSW